MEMVKMYKNSSMTVLVMSSKSCPRVLVERSKTVLRDDYKGNVKIAKNLLSKISAL